MEYCIDEIDKETTLKVCNIIHELDILTHEEWSSLYDNKLLVKKIAVIIKIKIKKCQNLNDFHDLMTKHGEFSRDLELTIKGEPCHV